MTVVYLREQLPERTRLEDNDAQWLSSRVFEDWRSKKSDKPCLKLEREDGNVFATGSYFVGADWVREGEVAVCVYPKLNDGYEIDYVRMLNDALSEPENFEHLRDLVTIRFDAPSIKIEQRRDLLSILLIAEYLNTLERILRKGLKQSFSAIEENLRGKVKGRILVSRNIRENLVRGRVTDNVCRYQVYGVDTPENRLLKRALLFCARQLPVYRHSFNVGPLERKVRLARPYFKDVGDDVDVREARLCKGNPIYRDYYQAVTIAQLLLRRFSYNITRLGKEEISTPPFWIDMSKLFELYVLHHLRQVFTGKGEVTYHFHASFQELDYLLRPELWHEPYIIDAKYKPQYKYTEEKEDMRQVAGYARLTRVYKELGLDPDATLPIKSLIVYPDQTASERFTFSREAEPQFDNIIRYARTYKVGIRLPVIGNKIVRL